MGILNRAGGAAEKIIASFTDMQTEITVFLVYGVGIFLIFYFGKQLLLPLRFAGRLAVNTVMGAGVIAVINLVGNAVSIAIPLNVMTAFTVGILGIPGAALLITLLH